MTFFITHKKQSDILLVLLDYRDATIIKRDKHQQKMEYYENLLFLEEANDSHLYSSDRYLEYTLLRRNYYEHKDKYEMLKLRYFSLQTNIDVILSYPHIVESL
jgi:hypothetical protein